MTDSGKQKIRAVSYCRTSGEGQRDNTSIPRQKADNERFVASQGWLFIGHYVDESLTGSTIEGREAFQQMLRDAADSKFDVIVPWDVTRFARDGCDIMDTAKFLKTNFGIHVVDSKGQFDTRDHRRTLTNFIHAGVAEDEKLRILERVIGGRIRRAQEGLPWTANPPAGREFKRTGKHSGAWRVSAAGKRLRELLTRYAKGEPLKALAPAYGFKSIAAVSRIIHRSQLSGIYVATFNCPDISINNLRVPIPTMPEVITPELEARVRDRLLFNRRSNKQHKAKYPLTGFIRCAHCGHALVAGQNGNHVYYRHYQNSDTGSARDCPFASIRAKLLESSVFDYLYGFFLDEPSFQEAVQAALPSADDRKALTKDIRENENRLAKLDAKVGNLVKAVAAGADVSLLLIEQGHLKAEKQALEIRLNELRQTLDAMPDPAAIAQEAMALRFRLMQEHTGKNWRKLPYAEVRRFLHFLFGDDPRKTGSGIAIGMIKDQWHITFTGNVTFQHDIVNGRPTSHAFQIEAATLKRQLRREYETDIQEVEKNHRQAVRESCIKAVKPLNDNG
jgi:site-specific DNA recombinase